MDTGVITAKKVAATFGISVNNISQPPHAFLTTVFLIDNTWVLRGRLLTDDAIERFQKECQLLDKARFLMPYALPNPISSLGSKERYVIEEKNLWTMYKMIPGEIHGTWQDVDAISSQEVEKLLRVLHGMHDATKNLLPGQADDWFIQEAYRLFQKTLAAWDHRSQKVLNDCFQRVIVTLRKLPSLELCFVHGDFHHGNILFNPKGEITGLVDCNWSRLSHPYEDVAYTVMTYLRNFKQDIFQFREDSFRNMVRWYGVEDMPPLLRDLLVVGALFDFSAWQSMGEERYASYQQTLVNDFQDRFLR